MDRRPRRMHGSTAMWLVAALAPVLALTPEHQAQQTPTTVTTSMLALPDGEGKALVERVCGGCHDPSLVMFKREDEEGWAAIVNDMAARGAKATPAELETITAYLSSRFTRDGTTGPLVTRGAREAAEAVTDEQRVAAGREIYQSVCVGCHQADGRGKTNVAAPLAGSELVVAAPGVTIRIMLHGKRGPTNVMPALGTLMTDDQIAAALSYIRREWGNAATAIDAAAVKEVRSATSGRARPWTADELRQAVGPAK